MKREIYFSSSLLFNRGHVNSRASVAQSDADRDSITQSALAALVFLWAGAKFVS
jgi:hypothetical protein